MCTAINATIIYCENVILLLICFGMNIIIFQDFVPRAASQFKTHEDAFLSKVKGLFLCFLFSDYLHALELPHIGLTGILPIVIVILVEIS